MMPYKPVCWVRSHDIPEESGKEILFEDPEDNEAYEPLVYQDPELNTISREHFWPIREGMSRPELASQIAMMNFKLAELLLVNDQQARELVELRKERRELIDRYRDLLWQSEHTKRDAPTRPTPLT